MSATKIMTVKVLSQTYSALTGHSQNMGITIGEVLDRIILHISTSDPHLAAATICDELLIITTGQNEEEFYDTVLAVLTILFKTFLEMGVSVDDLVEKIIQQANLQNNNASFH